jgi:hypothetical protein
MPLVTATAVTTTTAAAAERPATSPSPSSPRTRLLRRRRRRHRLHSHDHRRRCHRASHRLCRPPPCENCITAVRMRDTRELSFAHEPGPLDATRLHPRKQRCTRGCSSLVGVTRAVPTNSRPRCETQFNANISRKDTKIN